MPSSCGHQFAGEAGRILDNHRADPVPPQCDRAAQQNRRGVALPDRSGKVAPTFGAFAFQDRGVCSLPCPDYPDLPNDGDLPIRGKSRILAHTPRGNGRVY